MFQSLRLTCRQINVNQINPKLTSLRALTVLNNCRLYSTEDIPPRPTPPKCPNNEIYTAVFSTCKEEYRLLLRELRKKWRVELESREKEGKYMNQFNL